MRVVLMKVEVACVMIVQRVKFAFQCPPYIHKRCLPKGGGRGIQKMPKKETFTSRFGETREGRVLKNLKFGETSFMDGPICLLSHLEFSSPFEKNKERK